MATTTNEHSLLQVLQLTFEKQIEHEIDLAADEAAEKARAAVKKKIGALTCSLLSEYSVYRQGQDLIITVKIADLDADGRVK